MRPLVTPEEMARADERAVALGTPVEVLMDRAGRAVARTAIRMLGGRYGKRVVVVCGKGNNGGDGYVAERVLRREGVAAVAVAVGDLREKDLNGPDLVIDAILGTGSRGGVDISTAVGKAIAAMDDSDALVLAVDVPSGVDPATGAVEGVAVRADVTLSLAADKVGVYLGPPEYVGEIETADIGIPTDGHIFVLDRGSVSGSLTPRPASSHKKSTGSLAVLAGSDAMTGAAALVARAAMRTGCGYVAAICTPGTARVVRELCPEVLVHESSGQVLGPDVLENFSEVLDSSTAVVIGPGLGQGDQQRGLVERLIEDHDKPVVVDADGLNVVGTDLEVLARGKQVIVTPHPMEMARLLGTDIQKILGDRIAAARSLADVTGATVLLKGSRTIIAQPGNKLVWVNPTGGSELATAGTGDVLSGVIGAIAASDNVESAAVGAYLHGVAGRIAAQEWNDRGVVAWDVAEAIPAAMELIG